MTETTIPKLPRRPPYPGPIRLWLFRVPGFGVGDPRDAGTFWRVLGVAAFWAAVVYGVGLLWSIVFDFAPYRRSAAPLQVGALLAVMWIDVYWVAVAFPLKLAAAAEAIVDGDAAAADARRHLDGWATSPQLPIYGVLVLAACVVAFGVWPMEGTRLIGRVFEEPWLEEPRWPKVLLGVIWAIPVGSILATGVVGLVLLWSEMRRLAAHSLVESPLFVIPRLRHLVLFSHFTALAWSSPLAIFFVMTFGKQGLVSPWLVIGATGMGLFTLFQPHMAFHFALQRLEAVMSAKVRTEVDLTLGSLSVSAADRARVLAQTMTDPQITWLYDLRVLAPFSLGPLLPGAIGYLGLF